MMKVHPLISPGNKIVLTSHIPFSKRYLKVSQLTSPCCYVHRGQLADIEQ